MKRIIWVTAVWLMLWELLSLAVRNPVLLAGPAETAGALFMLVRDPVFWVSAGRSLLRIIGGWITGSALGILCAALSVRFPVFGDLLSPAVTVLKAIPVASFVVLVLIWTGSANLSLIITALVSFPILYFNTREGILGADRKLLEMAAVFGVPFGKRVRSIYLPGLMPFLMSAAELSVGMCFKSGVAAEVIGQPRYSLGNGLYRAKITLATAEALAWTAAVVFFSWLFTGLVRAFSARLSGGRYVKRAAGNAEKAEKAEKADEAGRSAV